MNFSKQATGLVLAFAALASDGAGAVAIGQIDTFEDGTTQNWVVNLLGLGTGPVLPANVPTGGPGGAGDSFMRLTAVGGGGGPAPVPSSRLSVINIAQWAGNYLAAGVNGIIMDVDNFGTTDLALRLSLSNPLPGPPTDFAISTEPVIVRAGSGWTSARFPIDPGHLTALQGDILTALSTTTEVRLFHSVTPEFPPAPVVASLGVDNIRAVAQLPEAPTALLLGAGLAALLGAGRRAREP